MARLNTSRKPVRSDHKKYLLPHVWVAWSSEALPEMHQKALYNESQEGSFPAQYGNTMHRHRAVLRGHSIRYAEASLIDYLACNVC